MFIRYYGPELQIGNAAVDAEREPRDLVSGDFNNDGTPDLLIVNAGLSSATHQIVLGQPAPNAPLGSIVRISTPPGMAKARVADFDHDGKDDVVLFPGVGSVFGFFEREQNLIANAQRIIDGLQPEGVLLPIIVAEIAGDAAEAQHEVVIFESIMPTDYPFVCEIEVLCFVQDNLQTGHIGEDRANRLSDVGGGEASRGDLIEQRLEQVVVGLIDERHLCAGMAKLFAEGEPTESCTQDQHPHRLVHCHVGSCRRWQSNGQMGCA